MSLPKQKFREIVFQMLYSIDMGKPNEEDMIPLLMRELSVTKKAVKDAQEVVHSILEHCPEIDQMIEATSISYKFERIPRVERNVLRLSIYELLYDDDIPPKVSISEGIRLSKKFASPESATFINALLDTIYKSTLGEKTDNTSLLASSAALIESEEKTLEISSQIDASAKVEEE